MTKNAIRRVAAVFFILTISGCSKNNIPQLDHDNITEFESFQDKYYFDSFNLPSTYALNMDSVRAMRKRGESFCQLLRSNLGYIQSFFSKQFDFDKHNPMREKCYSCDLDTCKNEGCRFNYSCVSDSFTIDKHASNAKYLPQLLFSSDKYHTTNSYYEIMLRLDFMVSPKTTNGILTIELDVSTEIIWRQRSTDDADGWERINREEQINDTLYNKFKDEYSKRFQSFLDKTLIEKGYLINSITK